MSPESLANIVNRNDQTENQPTPTYIPLNHRQNLISTNINSPKRLIMSDETNLDEFETRPNSNKEALKILPPEIIKPAENIKRSTGICIVNSRVMFDELSDRLGRPINFGNFSTLPEEIQEELFGSADTIYTQAIYKESEAGKEFCKNNHFCLDDVSNEIGRRVDVENDITSSSFSIYSHDLNPKMAPNGWSDFDKFVENAHKKRKKVIVDFVPNHVALDHPWTKTDPEYFLHATPEQYQNNPDLYYEVLANDGQTYRYAHGKDPNFDPWADTLQLNYANPKLQQAMIEELLKLIDHSDGCRCDMAMLENPETFIDTWKDSYFGGHLNINQLSYIRNNKFWPKAIAEARAKAKESGRTLNFVAEAYWDKKELGKDFDVIYYEEIWQALQTQTADNKGNIVYIPVDQNKIRQLLVNANKDEEGNPLNYINASYVENHDKQRAVVQFGGVSESQAAATVAAFGNLTFLMNYKQKEGYRYRIPAQIGHHLGEKTNYRMKNYYDTMLTLRNSRICQEGNFSVVWPDSKIDSRIIIRKYTLGNQTLYLTTNYCNQTASGSLSEIVKDDEVKVSSLTDNKIIENLDSERNNGMFVELKPWETQILFVNRTAKK